MSAEDWILRGIDRRREQRIELPLSLERAYTKAQEVLNNPDYSIKSAEFSDVYGDQIEKDEALVRKLEARFRADQTPQSANTKKIADVLEAIVLMQSEMSEWLGNATTLRTSPYDDYVNKVDMLAEWHTPQDGSRLLALAVDVTFGPTAIDKKLQEIKAEIDKGELGRVKYFKDARSSFKGTRFNVPRTVIGVSQKVVENLAHLWIEGEKKQLGTHPVQGIFINQMHSQLLMMRDYAHRNKHFIVADAYDESLSAVSPVHSDKIDVDTSALNADVVVEEITRKTRSLFGSR